MDENKKIADAQAARLALELMIGSPEFDVTTDKGFAALCWIVRKVAEEKEDAK